MRFLSISFLNSITTRATILIGIALVFLQFFYNRSLWGDEATLAINFVERDFLGLLEPLSYKQTAPFLFLFTEEFFSLIIPNSELGLRIFPLICYLGSIYFFLKIIKEIYKSEALVLIAISLFVFNYFLIYYSNEVKQYMVDVLFSTYFLHIMVRKDQKIHNNLLKLFISGTLAILYSNIAVVLLATVGARMLLNFSEWKNNLKGVFICIASLLIVFIGYYFLFISKIQSQEFLIDYWTNKEPAFMPLNPLSANFWDFMYAKYIMLFKYLFKFGNIAAVFLQLFMVAGLIQLFRKKESSLLLIIFLPVFIHLILSGLKLYPFHIRFCLYLIPGFILLIVKGLELLIEPIKNRFNKLQFPIAVFPLLAFLLFLNFKINGFPLVKEEYKKTLKHVSSKLKKEDKVFVFAESNVIYKYYEKIGVVKIPDSKIIMGQKFQVSSVNNQFSVIKNPVWLLLSGVDKKFVDEVNAFLLNNNFELKDDYQVVGATASYYVPKVVTE
jgi:hypothetical protein